jgi:hypothetical protein
VSGTLLDAITPVKPRPVDEEEEETCGAEVEDGANCSKTPEEEEEETGEEEDDELRSK